MKIEFEKVRSYAQRQGLAMWRYSVLRQAGTEVESSTKNDILQLAGIYRKVGFVDE